MRFFLPLHSCEFKWAFFFAWNINQLHPWFCACHNAESHVFRSGEFLCKSVSATVLCAHRVALTMKCYLVSSPYRRVISVILHVYEIISQSTLSSHRNQNEANKLKFGFNWLRHQHHFHWPNCVVCFTRF